MAATIKEIIQDCAREALGVEVEPLQTEVRDVGLASVNNRGRMIFDAWRWSNTLMDEFEAPAPDADGVITFDADVDVVRAVKAVSADGASQTRVWNEDQLIAAANGVSVSSDRFQHLADEDGCRRIVVDVSEGASTYRVLAMKRFVPAVVDADYDEEDPDDTPTDYRVLTFAIDRAEQALRAAVMDDFRVWQGLAPRGDWQQLMQDAVRKEAWDSDYERRVDPRSPMFEEVGGWW
jgi:hypothetical protein